MGTKWDEFKRSAVRSLKTNWNLFKQSKLGLVGLGIITFFVILAIFAPVLTLYPPTYIAPAGDLYIIDNYTASIPSVHQWQPPVSILTPPGMGKPTRLAGVWIYSKEGIGYFYPRDYSKPDYTQLFRLQQPIKRTIPPGMGYMEYLLKNRKLVGIDNTTIYLYPVNFKNSNNEVDTISFMKNPVTIQLAHSIKYISNIWDYNVTDRSSGTVDASIFMSVGSGNRVSLVLWVYGKAKNPITFEKITYHNVYYYSFTLNSTIIANPSVDFNYRSGQHWVIVPTKDYIYKFDVGLKYNSTYDFIDGISGVKEVWKFPMEHNGEYYQPVSPSAVTLVYPKSDQLIGKDILVTLCKNNYAFALYTSNGTVVWNNTIMINPHDARIHQVTFNMITPSVRNYLLVSGTSNIGGIVAELSAKHGEILENKTAYLVLRGDINYVSQYDPGSRSYYISTKEGYIYQLNETFYTTITPRGYSPVGFRKSFTVLGGAETPVVYLGNTLIKTNLVGAYVGVITKQNTLYLQASGGTRIPTIVIPPFSYGRQSHNFYLFGTDYVGHDIWSWLAYGSRTSLLVGLTAAFISVIAGTFIGIIAGFYGGWIDIIIMRIVDIILTLPGLVIMLLLAAVLGPNIWNIVLIIAVLGWAGIARVIRAQTLSLKNRPFMDAARVAGASNGRMIVQHIFPNVLPLTFLYMTFGVSGAILSEAALAFLGLGDPNAISWGMMLQYLRMYGQVTNPNAWAWLLMPGIFITLISLSFYLVGRAFDEIVNPRLRKR